MTKVLALGRGIDSDQWHRAMKRLRQLEEENGWLKQIVADLSLDNEMLQDVIKRQL